MRANPDVMSLSLAFAVAMSHADVGLAAYNSFQKECADAAAEKREPLFPRLLQFGVPAATNLSFGLEVLLKALVCQRTEHFPRGHSITDISGQLSADCRAKVAAGYEAKYASSAAPRFAVFSFISEVNGETVSEGRLASESGNLSDALDDLGKTYVSWRYMYEQGATSGERAVNLKALTLLFDVCRVEFLTFRSSARVAFHSGK